MLHTFNLIVDDAHYNSQRNLVLGHILQAARDTALFVLLTYTRDELWQQSPVTEEAVSSVAATGTAALDQPSAVSASVADTEKAHH